MRLSYLDLTIPAQKRSRHSSDCSIRASYEGYLGGADVHPYDLKLHYALPHYHSLGDYFDLRMLGGPQDGEMLYQLEDLRLTPDRFPNGRLWTGRGCDECFRSGYSGRTAIYEVMPIDSTIQEQVMNKATASEIKRGAIQRGLRTLRMAGVDKLLAGLTTADEVLRVTQLDVM